MPAPRNEIWYGSDFARDVKKLPSSIQKKLSEFLEILRSDAFDPRLHSKPLSVPLQGIFTFRITRNYRVAFEFSGPFQIKLLLTDRRNQIYKRLQTKNN